MEGGGFGILVGQDARVGVLVVLAPTQAGPHAVVVADLLELLLGRPVQLEAGGRHIAGRLEDAIVLLASLDAEVKFVPDVVGGDSVHVSGGDGHGGRHGGGGAVTQHVRRVQVKHPVYIVEKFHGQHCFE